MKEIKLNRGYVCLVSNIDYIKLSKYTWRVEHYKSNNYVVTTKHYGIETKIILMHRFILGLTNPKIFVDHINGNGLDNRRSNIRICTHAENNRNQKIRKGRKYKGVRKNGNRFTARISFNNEKIYLGSFNTELEAAKAYNKVAKKLHGKFARLNIL